MTGRIRQSVFEFAHVGRYVGGSFSRCFERFVMYKMFARVGLVSLPTLGASAFAAVPTEVTTAITDMKDDGLVVAGAVLVAIIAIAAVKFIRKGL
jgi:hypothetical protein